MLVRYKKGDNGKNIAVAKIYNRKEHGIDFKSIDLDALWVVRKLKQSGFEAYIVGGAVRDLLIGCQPKDFDIATSATPRQVQRNFWNARVIGKRFKLVHLFFKDKILEVSTFRSGEDLAKEGTSLYGTIDQDAKRRDFTLNSLYYDPTDGQLYDFNDALIDIKKKRIRSILELPNSFIEDPVRMIRAVKYSVTTNFSLQGQIKRAIKKHHRQLSLVSTSRLTEEVGKIICSYDAAKILAELEKYRLLIYMLPVLSRHSKREEVFNKVAQFEQELQKDRLAYQVIDTSFKAVMLSILTKDLLNWPEEYESLTILFKDIFKQVKALISPTTFANYDVQRCVVILFNEKNLQVPKQALHARRPKGQPGTKGFKKTQESSRRGKRGSAQKRRKLN